VPTIARYIAGVAAYVGSYRHRGHATPTIVVTVLLDILRPGTLRGATSICARKGDEGTGAGA
jgi:hypothetical protein